MVPDPLSRISYLCHFTDRRNLALIREMRGLYPLSELERQGVSIPAPGSDKGSREVDRRRSLHRYVHLCFKSNHPMEFVARQEGRIADTIFLQIHASVIQWDGVLFVPGMANTNAIGFYTMEQAKEMIDFEVNSSSWGYTNRAYKESPEWLKDRSSSRHPSRPSW